MNILVVEDELPQLRALKRILKGDHHVSVASSFEEAKRKLVEGIDLLITDYHLDEGHTGAELAETALLLEIPFIVMSGLISAVEEPWIIERALEVLPKPFRNDSLRLAVARIG